MSGRMLRVNIATGAALVLVVGFAVAVFYSPPPWGRISSRTQAEDASRKSTIEDRTGMAAVTYRHYLLKKSGGMPSNTYFGQLHTAAEMIEVAKARYAHLSQVKENEWEEDPIAQNFIKLANAAMDVAEAQ